jgi:hypothetical protein
MKQGIVFQTGMDFANGGNVRHACLPEITSLNIAATKPTFINDDFIGVVAIPQAAN